MNQVEQSQTALSQTKAVAMVKRIPGMTWNATKALALFLWEIMKNPSSLKDKLVEAQHHLKEVSYDTRNAYTQSQIPGQSGATSRSATG